MQLWVLEVNVFFFCSLHHREREGKRVENENNSNQYGKRRESKNFFNMFSCLELSSSTRLNAFAVASWLFSNPNGKKLFFVFILLCRHTGTQKKNTKIFHNYRKFSFTLAVVFTWKDSKEPENEWRKYLFRRWCDEINRLQE